MFFPPGPSAVPLVLLDSAHLLNDTSLAVLELPVICPGTKPGEPVRQRRPLASTHCPYAAARPRSASPDGRLSRRPSYLPVFYLLVLEGLVVLIVVGL